MRNRGRRLRSPSQNAGCRPPVHAIVIGRFMIEWKDTSSWCNSDVDRTPNSWTTHIGRFRLVVHRHRDYEPDQWLATCYPDVFCQFELSSKDVDEAKCQAVAKLQCICEDVIREVTSR